MIELRLSLPRHAVNEDNLKIKICGEISGTIRIGKFWRCELPGDVAVSS